MARAAVLEAEFLRGSAGKILVTRFSPAREPRGLVLLVPPFAEEMNKSRKMYADLGRQLALIGYKVLAPDLYGTGDSYGEFSSARWSIWREDLSMTLETAQPDRRVPVYLLGLRLGALLALETANEIRGTRAVILWSPCLDGTQYMNQFLRLRVASQIIGEAGETTSIQELRERLSCEGVVEIAGYELAQELVAEIDKSDIVSLAASLRSPIHWFDVTSREDRKAAPVVSRTVSKLGDLGCNVRIHSIHGPPFWATPELAHSQPLIEATTNVFDQQDRD